MLVAASAPVYAATEGAETLYQVMSPIYFAWVKYQEWKEAHPNEPDSAYPGFNPGGAFGGGAGRHEAEQKYNDYVATLPSTGYTSDGAILWHPTTEDVQRYYYAPPLAADFNKMDSLPAGVSELDDKTGYKITGRYTRAVLRNSNKGANKVK